MTTIETLTDEQREAITNCTDEAAWHAGCEALRIIDAQAEAVERLTAQCQRDFALAAEWKQTAETYHTEAEVLRDRAASYAALRAQLQEARNEVRHYSAELEESRKVNQALRNIVEQTLGTMRVANLQCESIDGGPMGTDARCKLRPGHGGGCEYV